MTIANVNIKKVLFRRGNTIQNDNYTGVNGEVSVDTEANTLRIHDGINAGGTRLATYAELADLAVGNINLDGYATTASIDSANVEIGKLRANITAANVAWTANAAAQATAINTINANLGAFQTYANTTFTSGGGSTYSNTNVAAFLGSVTGNIIPNANAQYSLGDATHWWRDIYVGSNTIYLAGVPLSIDANGDLLVDGNVVQGGNTDLTAVNANITAANSVIQTTNANIGAYQTWANANAGAQTTSINITNANIGAYQTWANANAGAQTTSINALRANITAANVEIAALQAQTYSNVNAAAYLAGAVTVGNITAGNLTVETNAVVLGNLRVVGTQTTVNATTLNLTDLYVTVADGATQASDANGAGLRVAGANANIAYSSVRDSFEFNKSITVGNVIFSNNTRFFNNNVTLPNGQGFNWHFNDPMIGSSTTTLYYNGLVTGFDSWVLETGNGTNAWMLDSDTQEFYLFNGAGDGKLVFGTASNAGTGSINDIELKSTVGNVYITANAEPWTFREDGNLILPSNMIFTSSPAMSGTGIIFGDSTYQHTAYQGPGSVIINGTHNAALDSTGNLTVPGSILPNTDNVYDLGSATMRFRHLYVGPGTVYVGNAAIKTTVTGNLILPGITRPVASTSFVEEVETTGDQSYSFATNPVIIDNALFEQLSGGQVSSFTPATYSSTGIDNEGYIRNIEVDTAGAGYASDVADLAEQNMWATEAADPVNNFNISDWIQIPFRAETRAGESEYDFNTGGASDRLSNNSYEAVLNSDGELSVPSNINFDGGGIIQATDEDFVITVQDADDDSYDFRAQVTDGTDTLGRIQLRRDLFRIRVDMLGGDKTWQFDDNGRLTLAGDIWSNYGENLNIDLRGADSVDALSLRVLDNTETVKSNLTLNASNITVTSGAYTWTFADDGSMVFPDDTVQTTAYTGGGGNVDTGDITFNGHTIGSTSNVVNISVSDYAQLQSNSNYIWVDSEGAHIEITANGAGTFDFERVDGTTRLKLPVGGDIVDSTGTSVLGGNTSTTNQLVNNEYTIALQSNGAVTIPGTIISGVTDPTAYRGFYATVNQISEQDSDPSLNQIILSRSATMRGYNLSTDTNEDTFFANGITGSSHVAVINLYGNNYDDVMDLADIKTFVQTYIDLVLYNGSTLRTDVADIQTAFAAAQTDLIDSLPANSLQTDFQFNEIHAVINTAGMTTSGSGSGFVYYYNNDDSDYSNSDETNVLVAGTGYQVNDTITVPGTALGGIAPADNMTITVIEVDGSGGIIGVTRSGSMDNTRFANLFVKHFVYDGFDDAYDQGNFIGTDRSECVFTATANGTTERITVSAVVSGELAPFQVFWSQNEDNYNYMILHQVSGTTGGAGVYATGGYDEIGDEANATVYTANGIYYGINDPQYDSPAFGGGDYVSMVNTSVGIFTMVAVNADIDRVSYLGETGADSDGVKTLTASFDIGTGVAEYAPIELVVGTDTWSFDNTGNLTLPQTSNRGIIFGDGTFQKTAYKRPDNLMLDGGGAATIYEVTVDYAEGGFSSTRYGVNTPSFNGGGAELDEPVYYTLDGGGA